VKPEADMIKNTALPHRIEGLLDHLERSLLTASQMPSQQESEMVRRGKFRSTTESSPFVAEGGVKLIISFMERLSPQDHSLFRGLLFGLHDPRNFLTGFQYAVTVIFPHGTELSDNILKSYNPHPACFGKVGPCKKRLFVRSHKDRHGPAAASGQNLAYGHVDLIHVRPFFPIHFDGYEILIQYVCNFVIFERLVRHHMTPVARSVSNRKENGFIPIPSYTKRLVAPRTPIHGIIGMLQ
jgi:hypothetical protein